ncbi:MAG: flagellar export chaperone FliS [Aquificae bacterium]|nr:flagellar export chaperone FliS [Aquificota bacterium]
MVNPYDTYVKTSVETASPIKQIVLLYEKVITLMKVADESIQTGDLKGKIESIYEIERVINALDSFLDFEKGGEIAQNLHMLYTFILDQMVIVNARNDVTLLRELIEIMELLREGWEEIEKKL